MPTIPTGHMERELKRLYMQWVHLLPQNEDNLHNYVEKFRKSSIKLIDKMGGDIARLGVPADFPAPKTLDLSLHTGTIYQDMELAAIQAQIGTGLNPQDTARALQRAGVDKSYRRLERLARTETVSAYWKNSWDSIEGLGLVMVWGAENGPRTCQWCLERDGLVMESPDLRDHPNGRCTPLPTHPSQVEYRGSVDSSGTIYQDPAWAKSRPVTAEPARDPSDLNTWQPTMSEADANSWAAGSKYTEHFWHGTSEANASRIMAEGFDLAVAGSNTGTIGLYGHGVYLAPSQVAAEVYSPLAGGSLLKTRVNVKNPMVVAQGEATPGFAEFKRKWLSEQQAAGASFPFEEAIPRAMRSYAEYLGHDSIVRVDNGTLLELVLFDKKQVVVTDKLKPR